MLLYYPFWMFMGFTLHFYIIFGTNLLTGGPTHIAVFFCLFQYFEEKEYQTESKGNETCGSVIFGTNVIPRAWSASQEASEGPTRYPPPPCRVHPLPRGAPEAPPTYFLHPYILTYLKLPEEIIDREFRRPKPP